MDEKEYRRAMVVRQIRLVRALQSHTGVCEFINREKALVAFMYKLYRQC